jgi:DNA-binding transcriptional MerR regulator
MTLSNAPLWTLNELSAEVALALAVDYPRQTSGRVRNVPDPRTIRYYTTFGLLDPPAQMRGRTALYGRRHLWQLVAIKRLQAKRLTLAEVQARVVGQTDAALRKLAEMPADRQQTAEKADTDHQQPRDTSNKRRGEAFWAASPEAVPQSQTTDELPRNHRPSVIPLAGVALDEGVTLLLQGHRPLDEHDTEALRSAAAPLLKLLRTRRIVDAEGETASG